MNATNPRSEFENLFQSPHWFAYNHDSKTNRLAFVKLRSRGDLTRIPFHFPALIETSDFNADADAFISCSGDALLKLFDSKGRPRRPTAYIFHMTLGGSTLLCRMLEALEAATVVKEPVPLSSLVGRKTAEPAAAWREALELITSLYSRSFSEKGLAIVKPHYWVNQIAGEVMGADPRNRGIFLYQDLRPFTVSILKKAQRVSDIVESVSKLTKQIGDLTALSSKRFVFPANPPWDDSKLAPHEAVAAFWLLNVALIERANESQRANPIRFLNSESLFADPLETLRGVLSWFGVPAAASELEAIAKSAILQQDAKNPGRKFEASAVRADRLALMDQHKNELRAAEDFVRRYCRGGEVPASWEPALDS
ncbi:MAG TPA: hypothetical protein VFV50_01630 [Bdellovibrionales bacterium]|nr:hypothetical protein [Bdellovibrionales bacterium]